MTRKNRYVEEYRQQEREKAERQYQAMFGRAIDGMWSSFVGDWDWHGNPPTRPPGWPITCYWDGSPRRDKFAEADEMEANHGTL